MRQRISSGLPAFMPGAIRRLRQRDCLALTFDDGPDPRTTGRILHALADLHMQATFFLVAERLAAHGALARDIRDAGHAIGLHGLQHEPPWRLGRKAFERELAEALAHFTREGIEVRLYRPPYGRMRPTHLGILRNAGLELVLWSLMPMEFSYPAQQAASFLTSHLDGGDIVVLHDRADCLSDTLRLMEILHEQVVRNSLKTVPLPYES